MASLESRLAAYSTPAIVPGLARIKALLKRLGNPERGLKVIHVAGSNGKGSVCRMLESVLLEKGFRTGLFISPHLIHFSERFRLNGASARDRDLEAAAKPLWKALRAQAGSKEGTATYFEAITALAFLYFKRQKVERLILETGLGGRFDSTNVIPKPLLTVITNISLEHTQILGRSEARIGWEKAGIIKRGSPLVTAAEGPARAAILKVFKQVQGSAKTPLLALRPRRDWRVNSFFQDPGTQSQTVSIRVLGKDYLVALPLLGRHQHQNLACVLAALQVLKLDQLEWLGGLARADWPARFQRLKSEPLTYLDGAHNPAGARALADTVQSFEQPFSRRALVVGVLKDKDWRRMFRSFNRVADAYFLATPPDPRGLEASVAAAWLKAQGKRATVWPSLPMALKKAQNYAGKRGLVVAAGSLYSAGTLLRSLTKAGFKL
jgi:dihydrofolate synthase/folylpolyglutamate synthase